MASGPSHAYISFRRAFDRVQALIRLERALSDPPSPSDQPLVEGLRGASVVLMVAAFEAYLRDVFEERLDGLGVEVNGPSFDMLPDRLRVAAVFSVLDGAMKGTVAHPVAKEKVDRLPGIRAAASAVAGQQIVGRAFAATGSNPGPETVKNLFKQVDYTPVFKRAHARFEKLWSSPVARVFAERQLDYVVNTRHEVAHGASVIGWSRQDLRDAERLVRILAKTLDDELRVHINQLSRVRYRLP